MYKCKKVFDNSLVTLNSQPKNKENNSIITTIKCLIRNCVDLISSFLDFVSSETTASIRIRNYKKRRFLFFHLTFDRCIGALAGCSFWQRHNRNLIQIHKTHQLIVIKHSRSIVVV